MSSMDEGQRFVASAGPLPVRPTQASPTPPPASGAVDPAIRMAQVIAHFRDHMDAGDLVCRCVLGVEADRLVAELADQQALIPLLRLDHLDEFAARRQAVYPPPPVA